MKYIPVNSFLTRTCSMSHPGFDPTLSCPRRRLVITPRLRHQKAKWITPRGTWEKHSASAINRFEDLFVLNDTCMSGVSPCEPMTWRNMLAEQGAALDLVEGNIRT